MKELKLAVIGKDVSQSASPQIHEFIAEKTGKKIRYDKISIPPEEFEVRAEEIFKEYDGFNVTIPFKLSVMSHLKSINGDAEIFGSVNTVVSAERAGYNTDGLGFMLMLRNNGVEVTGAKVLLLGAGGAGRSVAKKLSDTGATVSVYDKFEGAAIKIAQEFEGVQALEEIPCQKYDIIVNATGVGMHKTVGMSPVGEELISGCRTAVDLIYVPEKSRFLEIAESLGKKIINGSAMLFYQAYYSQCIYFGYEPNDEQAKELFNKYSKGE